MRLKISPPAYFGILLILISSLAHAAEPMLNGIAIHTELGKEQFIGALYSNPLSDNVETLTSSTQAMRMELKIIAPEGMTTRRFSRMWIEGMAINNASALLQEQADNMVKFDGLFKGKLAANDHIIFSYEPTKGVNIIVDDVLLGTIQSEKFFGMLLKTWVGKVALSSDFKEGILKVGNVSADLKARFAAIKPTKERTTEVAAWSKIKSAAELAEEKAAKEKESKSSSSQASSQEPAKEIAARKAAEAKAIALANTERAKVETAAKADEDTKPALTAQTLLARQFYVSDACKKVFTNARYPKRELEKDISGRVRVAVVIDRQGNIISTSLLESSQYEDFNDAALKAIAKTAPFPSLPDAISGSSFEFTIPISFVLPTR